jgi:cell filamentation protein
VRLRTREPLPKGRFDLAHLGAIHRHLFQDVHDWAGEVRTVEISKGGSQFMFRRFIPTGMADVHARLVRARFLRGLDRDGFAREAGRVVGDVNHMHPFRQGNGRTLALWLKQLAEGAGHPLDLTRIGREAWIAGSVAAQEGELWGDGRGDQGGVGT